MNRRRSMPHTSARRNYTGRRIPSRMGMRKPHRVYESNSVRDLDIKWSSYDSDADVYELRSTVERLSAKDFNKLRAAVQLTHCNVQQALYFADNLSDIYLDPNVRNVYQAGRTMYETGRLCGGNCESYVQEYMRDTGADELTDNELDELGRDYIADISRNNYAGFTSEGLCVIEMM